jgi:hypothetical protein
MLLLHRDYENLGRTSRWVSNGDFWKDYKREIDISRTPGKIGGLKYILRLLKILPPTERLRYSAINKSNVCGA